MAGLEIVVGEVVAPGIVVAVAPAIIQQFSGSGIDMSRDLFF